MAEEKIIEGGSGVGGRSMGPRYYSLCGRNAQSDPSDDEPDGLEHYGPPPPGSKPEPIVLLSSDNEVEDVTHGTCRSSRPARRSWRPRKSSSAAPLVSPTSAA